MSNNPYLKEMQEKSVWDLLAIVKGKDIYSEEEIFAARLELQKREIDVPDESLYYTSSGSQNQSIIVEDELEGEFPPKPEISEIQQNKWNGLFSMVAFIGIFIVLFDMKVVTAIILTGVVLIHELGHFLAMKYFKYSDLGIFFLPGLGAFAKGTKDKVTQKQELVILLAGPLPGMIIGIILYILGWQTQSGIALNTANIFLLINLFNLLPVIPLDGGKMIKILLFRKNQIINTIFLVISILFLFVFAIISKNYILLVIPFALVLSLVNQIKIKKLQKQLKNEGLNFEQSYDELDHRTFWLIRERIGQNFRAYSKSIEKGKYIPSFDEARNINMVKNVLVNHPEADLRWPGKLLFGLVVFFNLALLIAWGVVYFVLKLN
jgi:stage IV sporulation protein FB